MPIEPLLTRTCLLLLHSHSTCSYPHPLRHWFSCVFMSLAALRVALSFNDNLFEFQY